MKSKDYLVALALVALLAAAVLPAAGVLARAGQGYDLTWWTVDGGGVSTGSSPYSLDATIGQPDAAAWGGGGYTLVGGFWGGSRGAVYTVFLPLVLRQH
jgi:hypothetical protein